MKLFASCAFVLSTMLVVGWPLVFFLSIFVEDKPLDGTADHMRDLLIYALWAYPLGYLVTMIHILRRRSARKGIPWWASPTGFLFLLPIAHLVATIWAISIVLR
jgi:hypothetical protein